VSERIQAAQPIQQFAEQIHPSLRDSFVALPPIGTPLTGEQLRAVFGGDLRALRELWRLTRRFQIIHRGTTDHG
jgi:hypothetical protein